jgi:hypothetical protein
MVERPKSTSIRIPDDTTTNGQERLQAKQAEVTLIGVEATSDWEEDLLAAAEGHSELPEPNQHDEVQGEDTLVSPENPRNQMQSSRNNSSATKPRIKAFRTASIKYTPTEKYWLNRTYRLYRTQQAAQKLAKSRKLPYHPSEGVLTHQNMMDAFNDRFAGKFVDGLGPRPKRERHAFGLWSAKNMREDDEAMKGAVPNYWKMEQKTKPEGVSLEEDLGSQWDCDKYLGVTAEPEELKPQQSRKRKAAAIGPLGGADLVKRSRQADAANGVKDGNAFGEVRSIEVARLPQEQLWTHRRRYSAPSLGGPRLRSHLAQDYGDFHYSWSQAKTQLAWQEELRKAVARGVQAALNTI